MSSVRDRVAAVAPDIEKSMKIGDTAGLASGIVYKKEPVYKANYIDLSYYITKFIINEGKLFILFTN
jgi:hypothetical protein